MTDLSDLYEQAGRANNVDPQLLQAVARVESGERTFDSKGNVITSPAGAQGIMQFIPSTARQYGVNVADPASSINGGARYLSDLLNRTGGDVPHALALYNGSAGDRNQTYAKQVLAKYTPSGGGDRQIVQTAGPPAQAGDDGFDTLFGGKTLPPRESTERPGRAPGTVTTEPDSGNFDTLFTTPEQKQQQGEQPSWWARNIARPATGIFNPQNVTADTESNLLGSPLAQNVAAGTMAGARDVAQGIVHAGNWVTNEVGVPTNPTWHAIESKLAEQNEAWEQQHQGQLSSWFARLGGELLAAGPFVRAGLALTPEIPAAAGVAARIGNPALEGATAGGIQNVLTAQSQGEDPGNALLTGAVGGGVIGGATGAAGAFFNRTGGLAAARQRFADALGIRLSTGQRLGGAWQRIEDTTAPVPGSGAARFADEQRGDISALIDRELTAQPTNAANLGNRNINSAYLQNQATRIGNDIDNAARRITVTAPPGGSPFITNLQNIVQNAYVQGPQNAGPAVERIYNQLTSIMQANRGTIPGPEFQRLIARGNLIDAALNSADPNISAGAQMIREELMNAAQRSPAAPRDAIDQLQRARYQWKVLRTVQPAIERSVGGTEEMSLARLGQSIYTNPATRSTEPLYALMQLLGSTRGLATSGTAERAMWQKILFGTAVAGGGGGGAWWALQHPQEAEYYGTNYGAPAAAALLGARALRFGPSMGYNTLRAAQQGFNPLMPRVAAPYVGRQVLGQPQQ